MITALDTNVLSSIWTGESTASDALRHLFLAGNEGALILSPPVYAECLAHPTFSEERILRFLDETSIRVNWNLPQNTWSLAGARYRQYAMRRRKTTQEQPRRILADFIIGAHALLHADRLMTFDPRRYTRDFPELLLYKT